MVMRHALLRGRKVARRGKVLLSTAAFGRAAVVAVDCNVYDDRAKHGADAQPPTSDAGDIQITG
jgi:hypothetical protein